MNNEKITDNDIAHCSLLIAHSPLPTAHSFITRITRLGKKLLCGLFLCVSIAILAAEEDAPANEDGGTFAEINPAAEKPKPAPALDTEELRRRFGNEAKSELAAFQLRDAEVSLSVSGFWKGSLQGNLGFAAGPLGTYAVSPDSPVLFTQEADLTLDLWILKKWFVEASVLDNMDNLAFSTARAGYRGLPGEAVQYAGIGNTGLDFPVFPYLDLGGDSASSVGFYGNFAGGPFNFHALLRWDQAAREERTFVGGRERTFTYLPPRNSQQF